MPRIACFLSPTPHFGEYWHTLSVKPALALYWHILMVQIHLPKSTFMLYVIAIILIIGWALGFFVYSVGSLIHILLVIAIVAIILRVIRGDRVV